MAYKRLQKKSSFKKIIILSVLVITLALVIILANKKRVFVPSRAECADDYAAGYCGDWETVNGEHYVVNDDKTGWDLYEPGGSYKGSESAVDHRSYWDNKAPKTYTDPKGPPVSQTLVDEEGKPVYTIDKNNVRYDYIYDEDGNLTGIVDKNGTYYEFEDGMLSEDENGDTIPIVEEAKNLSGEENKAYFPIVANNVSEEQTTEELSGVTGTVKDQIVAIVGKFPVALMKTVARWLIGMTIF